MKIRWSDKPTILADPSVSTWVKTAITALDTRDMVDAANDAELVAALYRAKLLALMYGKD